MSHQDSGAARVCFIDMPFGKKIDPKSGVEIDFDQVFETGIEPAVKAAGLRCIRGDKEKTGGIIHESMFARLLLSEFVIADMTSANANVFYELGVRHAARPYTTIPIFATLGAPPFDVNMVRAIPYELEGGRLSEASATALGEAIGERIDNALSGPVAKDSPLFQLFDNFPTIQLSHELTDVFQDRIKASDDFQAQLDVAILSEPKDQALERLNALRDGLGELEVKTNEILIKLLLGYRDLSAWNEMVELYDRFPGSLQDATVARQQLALALNRRHLAGDRKRGLRILEKLLQDRGESAETYGLVGRIYKDQYREAKRAGELTAGARLDKAIKAYTQGFECEPADYYPGVNAVNLLIQKGTDEAQKELDRLTPLVSFAVARRGGAGSDDYWDLATVLELALIGRDTESAEGVLGKVLDAGKAGWMLTTTADNLAQLLDLRQGAEDTEFLRRVLDALRKQADSLP